MAETKKVTLKRGKESLEVAAPTYGGITALESLGWKVESGSKPARPKPAVKAETGTVEPFDADKFREEITAQVRAELTADAEKATAEAEEATTGGDGKTTKK